MLAILALSGVAGYFSARHEVDEIYDAQLANMSKMLMALMEHEAAEGDTTDEAIIARFREVSHGYEKFTAIRIWNADKLFFYTKSAENFGPRHIIAGFSSKDVDGNQWRFFVLPDARLNFTVEVAEDYSVRQDIVAKIIFTMFLPFVALLLLLPPLLWLGLRYGLRPLVQISDYVGRRSPNDLEPIALEKSPSEIWPLTRSINGLMQRVDAALTNERRFTDLAAHELRTPLAVIKTQVTNVMNAAGEKERNELLVDLSAGVQRASLMVSQLLSLARLGQDGIELKDVSLNDCVRQITQDMLPLALAKSINVELIEDADCTVRAHPDILAVAARNLLDNAIKYTPAEGAITLRISKTGIWTEFTVSDSGPGIPEDKLALVTDRFYRLPGNTEIGSGLGLAIVARAAHVMNAELVLANLHGLRAGLRWKSDE